MTAWKSLLGNHLHHKGSAVMHNASGSAEFGSRVEGIALVGQVKETLAVDLRIAFESKLVAIPRDRALTGQIRSIKKTPTDAGYARFDTEKNERHHADKFWALALAVHAGGVTRESRRRRHYIDASIV